MRRSSRSLGIVALILLARRQLNSVMGRSHLRARFVGIGFQEVENVVYSLNAGGPGPARTRCRPVWQVFVLRGLLSGLWRSCRVQRYRRRRESRTPCCAAIVR